MVTDCRVLALAAAGLLFCGCGSAARSAASPSLTGGASGEEPNPDGSTSGDLDDQDAGDQDGDGRDVVASADASDTADTGEAADSPDGGGDGADRSASDGGSSEAGALDGAAIAANHQACQGSCDVTASVGCRSPNSPTCVPDCERLVASVPCADELRAFLMCQAAAGPSGSFCDSFGSPTLMPDRCLTERAARMACRQIKGGL